MVKGLAREACVSWIFGAAAGVENVSEGELAREKLGIQHSLAACGANFMKCVEKGGGWDGGAGWAALLVELRAAVLQIRCYAVPAFEIFTRPQRVSRDKTFSVCERGDDLARRRGDA